MIKALRVLFLLILAISLCPSLEARESSSKVLFLANSDLKIETPTKTHILSFKEILGRIKSQSITLRDPVYKVDKKYDAVRLSDVFELVLDSEYQQADEFIIKCMDGYSPVLKASDMQSYTAWLAYRETGRSNRNPWQTFTQGKEKMTPAPYFLVWTQKNDGAISLSKSPKPLPADIIEKLPWPYQVVAIESVNFKKKYANLYPEFDSLSEKNGSILAGFNTFRQECFKCHSLNLMGGVLAPELNSPKSITEYWSVENIKAFIKNPDSFRYGSKMPAFATTTPPKLSDNQIDQVIDYLRWASTRKLPPR